MGGPLRAMASAIGEVVSSGVQLQRKRIWCSQQPIINWQLLLVMLPGDPGTMPAVFGVDCAWAVQVTSSICGCAHWCITGLLGWWFAMTCY